MPGRVVDAGVPGEPVHARNPESATAHPGREAHEGEAGEEDGGQRGEHDEQQSEARRQQEEEDPDVVQRVEQCVHA